MSSQNRLSKLEVTIGHAAASGDPEEYCLKCLGPGGYRRLVDATHQRIAADVYREPCLTCRGCGGPSYDGAMRMEREAWGLA